MSKVFVSIYYKFKWVKFIKIIDNKLSIILIIDTRQMDYSEVL